MHYSDDKSQAALSKTGTSTLCEPMSCIITINAPANNPMIACVLVVERALGHNRFSSQR